MPNKWTFQIPPIRDLVARYVGDGKGWIDPFAGMSSPAEFTNDLNPAMPAQCHLDALNFIIPGGIAISCGWNSIGMGKTHGFEIIEILLVCHGRAHNDTIVTVERKIQNGLSL